MPVESYHAQHDDQNQRTSLLQALVEFFPALVIAGPYALWGLALGFLTFSLKSWVESLLGHGNFATSLLEHLGVGIVVSAIAVVFYEWGAHTKKTMGLAARLQGTLAEQQSILQSAGRDALDRSLQTLIRSDSPRLTQPVKVVIENCKGLVEAISGLPTEGNWAKDHYISFVATLIDELQRNTHSLWKLKERGEHSFILKPRAAEISQAFLIAQMSALSGDGDSYEEISELRLWQNDYLTTFHEETKGRGIKVKRLFNLLRRDAPPLAVGECEQVRTILKTHLHDSRASKAKYEVRVFGTAELDGTASKVVREQIQGARFGVFTHEGSRVRFRIHRPDLSYIMMCTDPGDFELDVQLLTGAWSTAIDLENKPFDDILCDLGVGQAEIEGVLRQLGLERKQNVAGEDVDPNKIRT